MLRLLLAICFLAASNFSFSQNHYEIKKIGTLYSSQQLTEAFNSAKFCGSHFRTKRNLWKLDDGSEVELLSASEIPGLDQSCIIEDDTEISYCEYSINSGVILKRYTYEPSEQKKKEILNKSK